ncbi:hypothetical protein D6C78_08508 [Aureobasidium pullulans]|uniref:Helicase C-terminal domain-containing protein n=1 Tax=Aureobasidium pullulans TaxID=5580 RepID=A0A4T0BD22_AURPU|nr:hypothetical protein D6C78_08508 [Aureobasidium pullulans]
MALAFNFQVASTLVIVDYPHAAAALLQAKSRICRIGQEEKAKILMLLAHNTIDRVIAARTEAKHIPILAGSAQTAAQRHEVETAMRKANIAESL